MTFDITKTTGLISCASIGQDIRTVTPANIFRDKLECLNAAMT